MCGRGGRFEAGFQVLGFRFWGRGVSRFFPYLGGKHQLAKDIIVRMPVHETYCEVFGGSGAVLLAKPESINEVFNDINKEVSTLFNVVKNHYDEFLKEVRWLLWDRNIFDTYKSIPGGALTDIQRSARFYYLLRTAYGGKSPHKSHFAGGGVGNFSAFMALRPTC